MSLISVAGRGEGGNGAARPNVGVGDILDLILFVAGSSLLLWVLSSCIAERPEMWDAATLLGLNGVLAGTGFAIALRRKCPILMTCFYFDFIFLAVAPIQQIERKFDPIFSYDYAFYSAIAACLMFTLFGLIALYASGRPVYRNVRPRSFFARSPYKTGFYPAVLLTTILIVTAAMLAVLGPQLFTSRGELGASVMELVNKSGSLVLTTFLAPLVLIGSAIGLRGAIVRLDRLWILAFLAALLLAAAVSINPIVVPRFRTSALTLFVLLTLTGWNNTRAIGWFLVAGVAVSPLLNAFRGSMRESYSFDQAERQFNGFFAHMDFDCFSMIEHVVYYVVNNGYSYGANILAGMFFFVPRAIWPGKSEHVGHYIWPQIRYYRDVWTDNVSSAPFAEGYFAYGTVGAIVFCACVWAGFVLLERGARSAEQDSPLQLMACLTPMYAIMVLRGPFLVGYSELWGNYAALFAALILLHIKIRVASMPRTAMQRRAA